jgi:ABC-type nitrate/sulfonate/bicarbonate transport system ATPase subunit
MPQKDLLMPWRTVADNVVLGMEVAGVRRDEARREAMPLIEAFGLGGFESAYPRALSGGMRQRAAFLRTVLFKKDILLLDEPFGALDALTRQAMHEWLLDVWEKLGTTIVFVTHDVEEATFLSDRVYVMTSRPGQIKAELPIDLPRPRTYDVVVSEDFLRLKAQLLAELRAEGLPASVRAT